MCDDLLVVAWTTSSVTTFARVTHRRHGRFACA
jgi:hypothetical protein